MNIFFVKVWNKKNIILCTKMKNILITGGGQIPGSIPI